MLNKFFFLIFITVSLVFCSVKVQISDQALKDACCSELFKLLLNARSLNSIVDSKPEGEVIECCGGSDGAGSLFFSRDAFVDLVKWDIERISAEIRRRNCYRE